MPTLHWVGKEKVVNLDSVQWWHRNLSRGKGFRINGFLNHYPDFIVKTDFAPPSVDSSVARAKVKKARFTAG